MIFRLRHHQINECVFAHSPTPETSLGSVGRAFKAFSPRLPQLKSILACLLCFYCYHLPTSNFWSPPRHSLPTLGRLSPSLSSIASRTKDVVIKSRHLSVVNNVLGLLNPHALFPSSIPYFDLFCFSKASSLRLLSSEVDELQNTPAKLENQISAVLTYRRDSSGILLHRYSRGGRLRRVAGSRATHPWES